MRGAGFDRAHIAGNSLGGWVALELARRGRARTVTAISPAGLQHAREKEWGAGILRGMRWLARNAPAPEPRCATPSPARCSPGPARAALAQDPDR